MTYQDFDWAGHREASDCVAALLTHAGIRFQQRVVTQPDGRGIYVIAVHPDDLSRAEGLQSAAQRRKDEGFARTLHFVCRPLAAKDMLIARQPSEAGYYVSQPYHGQPFDNTRFRLVRDGWDHGHCYLCYAKIMPGNEWWVAQPPGHEDELGLCSDCHARLFSG